MFEIKMYVKTVFIIALFFMGLNGYFLFVIYVDVEYQKKIKIDNQYLEMKLESKQRELFHYQHQRIPIDKNELKFKKTDPIDMIYYFVSSSGLSLQSFYASTEVKRRSYTELPLELAASGTYDQLVNFLDAMTALDSIMTWQDFVIQRVKSAEQVQSTRSDEPLLIDINAKIYKDNGL